jgi:hypothetical protein
MKNVSWTSYFVAFAATMLAALGAFLWLFTAAETRIGAPRTENPLSALIASVTALTVLILYPLFRWLFLSARPANTTTITSDDAAVYVAMFILLIVAFPTVFVLICCVLSAVTAGCSAIFQGAIAQ